MRTEPQDGGIDNAQVSRRWRVNVTPIRSQIEGGGPAVDLVMIVMPREAAKQLLRLGGMELADLPVPIPRNEP
jgi:hypothetical protein